MRDERVLGFINVFDEAMSRKGLVPGPSAGDFLNEKSIAVPGATASSPRKDKDGVSISPMVPVRNSSSIAAIKEMLRDKTSPELASEAGSAARMTGVALVAATSRYVTMKAGRVSKEPCYVYWIIVILSYLVLHVV
jgi:hypothetical protein